MENEPKSSGLTDLNFYADDDTCIVRSDVNDELTRGRRVANGTEWKTDVQ